jgi:S-adenosylmethionine:tRNA ribosyltransferase-isomerase
MRTDEFNYELPKEMIAQYPAQKRDYSSLMVINKKTDEIEHKHFYDIIEYINEGDCLVFNDSKVIRARLYGQKVTGAKIELLLLKDLGNNNWQGLLKPAKRLKENDLVYFDDKEITARVINKSNDGLGTVEFICGSNVYDKIEHIGKMPLPPYIKDNEKYYDRYQTVYAKNIGSSAAPTAGLHFTDELIEKLKQKGVKTAYVTLHVGLDTFRPVKADELRDHKMHAEHYQITKENAQLINEAKKNGKRIIAVGTTSMRTLEGCAKKYGRILPVIDDTDIFIYPPYEFKAVDCLITNFHLPKSTLLMLVSAFYNKDKLLCAYKTAIERNYRFFSFGDAMLLY